MQVLITGASSGIGRSMAYIFAKKNYDLILVARTKEKLENIKKEITNVNVEIKVCDLNSVKECVNLHQTYPKSLLILRADELSALMYLIQNTRQLFCR